MSDVPVDRELLERINLLHDKLRRHLAMSTRWQELLEEKPLLPIEDFAKQPPVQVQDWSLDECREVWDWLQGGGKVPEHLSSELGRFRA